MFISLGNEEPAKKTVKWSKRLVENNMNVLFEKPRKESISRRRG